MLGVVRSPYMPTNVDRVMREVAIEIGRGETFDKAPVGVSFRTVGSSDDITECVVVPSYPADHRRRVAIARLDGRLYAFGDLCTCASDRCPLSGGLLTGTTITCQCQGSRFEVSTGAVLSGPATEALTVYEVRQLGAMIQVRA
jgi:3-phenylpropionate/trans-cinnamate dioxygenase ferredoxin subunit